MAIDTLGNTLHLLKKEKSVHWCLFGVQNKTRSIYLLEVIGNECSKTEILSTQEARSCWRYYRSMGFREIELKDAGGIPLHLDQRMREWWKFVNKSLKDGEYMDDPWAANLTTKDDAKVLTEIADGKYLRKSQHEEEVQYAEYWEYRLSPEDESEEIIGEEDADDSNCCDEFGCEYNDQDYDESYQRWAMEEEKRDEEIERAIEEYYASYDSEE